ncbi:NmrA family NAD(P)-binding protein [Gluconobacter sp. R75690]|uniref:NmrA family NAD(P)-binding protein n=1 Tax=Gluconobacter TaxID=441 RepID=UPI001889D948|nr:MULTISPECIES: NmrA family NAD(P)-binding protein [unclassified Gluconobacter]MBF0850154.1 NmrA family NAD(P)-binding protein [Gluconobacter sp. R75690]MBF0879011.1 NmrA family NAD(P)-binding protein [Gluconobacter sp. R75828]
MDIVLGASGHVGGTVARRLLEQGRPVTVVLHRSEQDSEWSACGASVAVLDVHDTAALTAAFCKARRAFLLNPPASPTLDVDHEERRTVHSIIEAVRGASLEKIVVQSTYGAQDNPHCGDLGSLYTFEQGARETGVPFCVVRAAYFMSNWYGALSTARQSGVFPSLLPKDFKAPMVAPQDVGELAARLLVAPVEETGTYSIEGPETYTPEDVATVLGAVLGQAVTVDEIPRSQWLKFYRSHGFCPEAAQSYATMTGIFVDGLYDRPRTPLRGATDLQTCLRDQASISSR